MSFTRLEATAFHESGHAVMSILHMKPFRKATINAEGDNLGQVVGYRTKLKVDELRYDEPDGIRLRRWAESNAQILLAGDIAEHRFTGRWNHVGAGDDLLKVSHIASVANDGASDKVLEAWTNWQSAIVEDKIQSFWEAVEGGSAALLQHQTLTYREFRDLAFAYSRQKIAKAVAS